MLLYAVLPQGASRYPDYGPATVGAVAAAHAAQGTLGLGLGAVVGLITGMAGGMSMHVVRGLTTRAVRRASAALDAGGPRLLVRLPAAAIPRAAGPAPLVPAPRLALP